jgi:hypothetical protein
VRTFIGDLLQIHKQEEDEEKHDEHIMNSKVCVKTLSFRFDAPPPVYANWMQKG